MNTATFDSENFRSLNWPSSSGFVQVTDVDGQVALVSKSDVQDLVGITGQVVFGAKIGGVFTPLAIQPSEIFTTMKTKTSKADKALAKKAAKLVRASINADRKAVLAEKKADAKAAKAALKASKQAGLTPGSTFTAGVTPELVDAPAPAPAQVKAPKAPKAPRAPKAPTSSAPSAGRLGGVFGFSVTAVLRALGGAGWSNADARTVMAVRGVKVQPTTVSLQCGSGRHGDAGRFGKLAPLTKDQLAELKSDLANAPAPVPAAAQ